MASNYSAKESVMKYILQIHTGSWHDTPDEPERIIRRIEEISGRIPVDKVIIGWSTDPSVYAEVGDYLHRSGISMILWLPVFSETNKIMETDEALDVFGNRIIPHFSISGRICTPADNNLVNRNPPGNLFNPPDDTLWLVRCVMP